MKFEYWMVAELIEIEDYASRSKKLEEFIEYLDAQFELEKCQEMKKHEDEYETI